MDEIYDTLAARLIPTAAVASNPCAKHIVGLAGPPGAGMSTVASEVVRCVNKLWPQKASSFDSQVNPPDVAVVLPMDGFHLYRSQLDAMEDPEDAHARRGAPWTFAPTLRLKCLKKLRNELSAKTIAGAVYAPSFSHGVGDPVEDDVFVSLWHKVVIVEGNYLLLDDRVWKDISDTFDEKWFTDVDISKAMLSVLNRHISTCIALLINFNPLMVWKKGRSARSSDSQFCHIPGNPPDVAKWRIEYNDQPNSELVMSQRKVRI